MRVVPTDGFARFYRKDHDCSKRSDVSTSLAGQENGTTHTYWRLVRSVRRNGRVVQQTVAQLGNLDAQERAAAKGWALE
ncbi:MAG: hypothetical protein IPM54_12970 [Polyangiaceae bacterium]|nr:hypothetical protein [Polyangiaceae bacterium]